MLVFVSFDWLLCHTYVIGIDQLNVKDEQV